MTNWLPDEEVVQLRFAFEAKIRRPDAAERADLILSRRRSRRVEG
jgi:hypothetical protein